MSEDDDAMAERDEASESSAGANDTRSEPRSERARILGMVSEGTVTVDEAEQLLRALDPETGPIRSAYPPGPFFTAPVPPVPPVPPMPPVPPVPPMSAMAAAGPHIAGAGDMLMYRAGPEAPGKKRREPPYAIRFDIEADDKEMHASLPLGLVDSADKYLPRPMRPYLEEFGVDTRELVELIKSIPLGELPQFPAELRLFDLEQGDRSISVLLYVVGP